MLHPVPDLLLEPDLQTVRPMLRVYVEVVMIQFVTWFRGLRSGTYATIEHTPIVAVL